MKKEAQKISSELAIGVILVFSLIVGIAIYKAGSFSAVLDYIPQKIAKKETKSSQPERILFATNGTREVYKVKKDDGKWAVVIDGQEGEAYDDVFAGTFSDDGEQFAYGARDGGEEFVVLDNRASDKKYKSIGQIVFSKDGKLIYKVIGEDGVFLVIDGQEGQHYTSIGEVVIMDDGRIAFQAELNGEQVTVIDGQVVNNNQNSGSGQGGTGTSGGDQNGSGSSGGSNGVPVIKKSTRPKKDQVIPQNGQSYPVCEGNGCNF